MKKTYKILVILCFVIGCKQNEKESHSKTKNEIDSLRVQIELLQEEIQELKFDKSFKSDNENFESFLFEFMADSVFQKKRTKFPLTYIHWKDGYHGDKIDTVKLTKENWEHKWLYMIGFSEVPQIYDNFEMELRPTDKRLLHFTGVETGTNSKYFFEIKEKKWHLTKMINLGD